MDTRRQKLILILILFICVLTVNLTVKADDCIADGLTVCFDVQKNAFKIEPQASLKILVPNEDYGQAVVDYWNWYHPEFIDRVTYQINTDTSGAEDVLFISQVQAGALHDSLYPMHEVLSKNIDQEKVFALNYDQLKFIPMSAEGFTFLVNKSRLELLGVSTEDLNHDGLIDSVDSFEKIFELQALWDSLSVSVLPIALNEPYSFYPFLTAGGFEIFKSYDALKPGFDSEQFKLGLQFIKALSQIHWNHSETNTSDTYKWKLDEVLVKDDFIFTLAGPWMNIQANDAATVNEWMISKFPTYLENELSPLVRTSGFAINAATTYPSAAHELIRTLKSIKGIQLLIDHTKLIPLANDTTLSYLIFEDPQRAEMVKAYQSSVGEPVIAYPNNPKHLAYELLGNMNLMSIMRDVWDNVITVEEAQAQVIAEAARVEAELNTQEVIKND